MTLTCTCGHDERDHITTVSGRTLCVAIVEDDSAEVCSCVEYIEAPW